MQSLEGLKCSNNFRGSRSYLIRFYKWNLETTPQQYDQKSGNYKAPCLVSDLSFETDANLYDQMGSEFLIDVLL